ncbi:MAG: tetratricopeptide repeat protein [Woeseiaceae bacterium]
MAGLALCAAAVVSADEYRQFPGAPTDSQTLRTKEKVEEIYSSGNYERAMLIYEKELAPQGDKYAQYMVGYMHLAGRGVEKDPAEALAWYRLAAERGEPKFIQARDALYESLDADALAESEARFADLWQHYGDRKLILDLIRADLQILHQASDTDFAGGTSHTGIVSGYSGSQSGDPYLRRVRAQLTERLQYLNSIVEDKSTAMVAETSGIDAMEAKIRQDLKGLDRP